MIHYLESSLIDLAGKAGKSDSDNKKRGNPQKVDEFRQAELEQYLEEALFLLELIGVRVFKKETKKSRRAVSQTTPPIPVAIVEETVPSEHKKPSLQDDASLGPCAFAKTALMNLLASGYQFSDEQMELFGSVSGSKSFTLRNLPMFWILKDGETRATCDKNVRSRYWKDEFVSGKYRFLMYSQWYSDPKKGATKDQLIAWYNSL